MRKIAVMSGKGGVGKSSIAILISKLLSEKGKTILLDFDLCGPSCTKAFEKKGKIFKDEEGLVPLNVDENLSVISMGYMVNEKESIIWRGPKKLATLNMFYRSIKGFDYVVIDMPPGVSEEHGFLIDKDVEVIAVTTSQNVALSDSLRCLSFCLDNKIKILGLIENMSGYTCDCCGYVNNIFSRKGGQLLAEELGVNFLGSFPIDPYFSSIIEDGSFSYNYKNIKEYSLIKEMIDNALKS